MSHSSPEALATLACQELEGLLKRTAPPTPKERIAITAQEMPTQDPAIRRRNVQEVALGYTPEQARLESMRCLQCRNAPVCRDARSGLTFPDF